MGFTDSELANANTILSDVLHGLIREKLIDDHMAHGPKEFLDSAFGRAAGVFQKAGIAFGATLPGVRLFLWAHGHGNEDSSRFLDPSLELDMGLSTDVVIHPGFAWLGQLGQHYTERRQ